MTETTQGVKIDDEVLLEKIREVADKLEKNPSLEDFEEHTDISTVSFNGFTKNRPWDTWNEAKRQAGVVEEYGANFVSKYENKEQVAERIRSEWSKEDGMLTYGKLNSKGIANQTLHRFFDSLEEIREDVLDYNDKTYMFRQWEKQLSGRYGKESVTELVKELDDCSLTKLDEFRDWLEEESDKLEVRDKRMNSNSATTEVFIDPKDKNYRDVLYERYGDDVPDKYDQMFKEFVSQGFSPKTIVGTIKYFENDDVAQSDVDNCSAQSVRNIRDKIVESEFKDLVPEKYLKD